MQSPSPTIDKRPDFDLGLANFTERQMEAVKLLDSGFIKFLLYGGALGGGKSYFLRWYGLRRLMLLYQHWGISNAVGMLACEDYPSLKDRQLQKIGQEFPSWLGKLHSDHKLYGKCFILRPKWGSGVLCFRNLDDPSKYASAEFAFILVDELTKNEYDVFTFLRTRARWPGLSDVECHFAAGTNPGSIGHGWVKQLWMDKDFGEEWYINPQGIDYRPMFSYVPSLADDNPHLDPSYWSMLETLPPNLRQAFRYGNWDIFVGQAFPEFSRQIHVIKPIPIPEYAPMYMTFDWGYGKPFSIGWWWVDADGRVYRWMEWYGWNGTADQGIRLSDSDIADGLIRREQYFNLWGRREILRLAGPDCWNKKPDYKGGGQGPSTAEIFAGKGIYLVKADPKRELKIRQFRERLRVPDINPIVKDKLGLMTKDNPAVGRVWEDSDGKIFQRADVEKLAEDRGIEVPYEPPMMLIYDTCKHFIRTIPNLVMDEHMVEDIDTDSEDHPYDESCHVCMARPLAMHVPGRKKSFHEKRIDMLESGHTDSYTEYADLEHRESIRGLGVDDFDFGQTFEYEDGEFYDGGPESYQDVQ